MSRIDTVTNTVFKFDELSDDAKAIALDANRDWNTEGLDWWDSVYDDAKAIAALMGIDISTIYFSGFWSQGDGACFEGTYAYKAGSVKAVKAYAPWDKELHGLAEALQAVQKRNFYQLHATARHSGFYQHSGCMAVSVDRDSDNYQDPTDDAESEVTDQLRWFADWIYSRLEAEHDYLTSDDAVAESLVANEYEFLEDGTLYH